MTLSRRCSRTACGRAAVATLTYVYADSVAVLGPLATYAEPHAYDLCDQHAQRLTAPRGWEVVRLAMDLAPESHDDLVALANVVREARRPATGRGHVTARPVAAEAPRSSAEPAPAPGARRGHLRAVPTSPE